MFPTQTVIGYIGRNITQETQGGFRKNHPLLVTLVLSKWVNGREGQAGRQETDTWLMKLWPLTLTDYNNLCYRLHKGAHVEVLGEFRTGAYKDERTGLWSNNPYIHVINFQVHHKAEWRLKEEAEFLEETLAAKTYEDQVLPNANLADQGKNPEEKTRAGNATRKPRGAVTPDLGSLSQMTNTPLPPATPQYTNDLDDDLPF